ncbi:MAG TPA: hypothetical protein RMH26_23220 [Polyangiaceae bacterium LLY-WYZ-15_(1-7)]|nr:hypothetical protein [Polyangiaceae bacterium LLY-WYZ-15_(1-7)]
MRRPGVLAAALLALVATRSTASADDRLPTRFDGPTDAGLELARFGARARRTVDDWQRLCRLPCALRLRPARYLLALDDGARFLVAEESLRLTGGEAVTLERRDGTRRPRRFRRTAAVMMALAGLSTLGAGLAWALQRPDQRLALGLSGATSGFFAIGIALLVTQPDAEADQLVLRVRRETSTGAAGLP